MGRAEAYFVGETKLHEIDLVLNLILLDLQVSPVWIIVFDRLRENWCHMLDALTVELVLPELAVVEEDSQREIV